MGLVLTRKKNEKIRIKCGDTIIWVNVAEIRGNHAVRIMVNAPRHVDLNGGELVGKFQKRVETKKKNLRGGL